MNGAPRDTAGLSREEKRALLARLLEKGEQRRNVFPLSFAQRRLWFLEQLEPGHPTYHIPAVYRIRGPLNIDALRRTLCEVVQRHEALRTTFVTVEGEPVQVIAAKAAVALPIVDLCTLPEVEREDQAVCLAAEEARRLFDLTQGPLFRATLLRLENEDHMLLVTMHHIVSDGWSMGILLHEIAMLYEAFSNGRPSPLPELPIQYGDFASWQRERLRGEALDTQLRYWKRQLGGTLPKLQLPTDRPRPVVQTFGGARQPFTLSGDLLRALKALSIREACTLFMTLLAAFKALLCRYSGQDDIVVGTPIANRNRVEIEGLIGLFVNTLVLRTDASDNPTFRQLLCRVRDVTLAAYDHQDMPFEKLVEELRPERDLSRTPLFQVMFSLQNAPEQPLQLPNLSAVPLEAYNGAAKFDLSVYLWEGTDGLAGVWEYNTDLFDKATVVRMTGHFQALLQSIVENPEQRLSEWRLLSTDERRQLLVEWNATATEYPHGLCAHQMFEAQVERTPDAVAVVCDDEQLTYRELNRRANQLAFYLRRLGVGPEALVGICMERSAEMTTALLAVLKAGGAYVPLDPTYPKERLAFMLNDTQAWVVLTQQKLVETLREHQARIVCLDRDWEAVARYPEENPASETKAENLAYVIYTSGSTGRPKGVQVQHRGVTNFLHAMRERLGLTHQDALLAVTTLSFDIAVLEIFLPLTTGARVVLVSREVAADGTQLSQTLADRGITIMQATPATWQLVVEAGWQRTTPLKILCGGEALSRELAGQLLERSASVCNMYGPTETTIWSTVQRVEFDGGSVPIGRPIANTQVYVLDPYLQPVPVGVTGELYIGGDGLARGYLNLPELTAEKFVPNPFGPVTGGRLYKTGDLGRYRPDGNIECLGRNDQQVKVRGFRIELGEVEAALCLQGAVTQAVVLAREDLPGGKRLVAYVVANRERGLSVSELRSFLQEKLPSYMVPSVFVPLDALPLTPNGKVDRRALPVPDGTRPDETLANPRTPIESLIAEIWRNLLAVDRVSVDDNFFDLGGHSLLLMRAIAQLDKRLGLRITPREFMLQTLGQLASSCEERLRLRPQSQPMNLTQKLLQPIRSAISYMTK